MQDAPPPPPRRRGGPVQDTPFPASGDVTGTATATLTGSATHCDVTRDTAVGTRNRQQATVYKAVGAVCEVSQ
jgi:hypothetical protein